jgi:hypothetical protein
MPVKTPDAMLSTNTLKAAARALHINVFVKPALSDSSQCKAFY